MSTVQVTVAPEPEHELSALARLTASPGAAAANRTRTGGPSLVSFTVIDLLPVPLKSKLFGASETVRFGAAYAGAAAGTATATPASAATAPRAAPRIEPFTATLPSTPTGRSPRRSGRRHWWCRA
jgi:hypothetical protein